MRRWEPSVVGWALFPLSSRPQFSGHYANYTRVITTVKRIFEDVYMKSKPLTPEELEKARRVEAAGKRSARAANAKVARAAESERRNNALVTVQIEVIRADGTREQMPPSFTPVTDPVLVAQLRAMTNDPSIPRPRRPNVERAKTARPAERAAR